MKRIINHWTAGTYTVSATDKKHYHVIIDGDGKWVKGNYTIEANEDTGDGDYAAHTLNCNEGSIGVSCAAMYGAVQGKTNGSYPLKKEQWEEMIRQNARFCIKYNIPVTPQTVLTHAEVQSNLHIKQKGKWDISVLPFDDSIPATAEAVGNELRRRVAAEITVQRKQKWKDDTLVVKPKPVLKSSRVQTTAMGFISGGGAATLAALNGFDWRGLAILIGAILFVVLFFWWRYREQIEAGMFGAKQ